MVGIDAKFAMAKVTNHFFGSWKGSVRYPDREDVDFELRFSMTA